MTLPAFKIVIADTSCFILLHKIDEMELLHQMFDEIYTTSVIAKEFGYSLPDWIKIADSKNSKFLEIFQAELDQGEASALALHMELKDSLLILDDLKARKYAEKLRLPFTGTFGIMSRSKKSGIIASVKPILEKIRKTDFRFSENFSRNFAGCR